MEGARGGDPAPERDDRRAPARRDDFGLADYSSDFDYDPARRTAYRNTTAGGRTDDYGQADYSEDYAYDPARGHGYRRFAEDDRDYARRIDEGDDRRIDGPARSWRERAGTFFTGRDDGASRRRRGPSDRVLWTVIVERLEDQRGLDLRDVEVLVDDGEVTLNGTVRRKLDKRRIEDIADLDGVRHVQNNLRVRDNRWF
jgi:hypothetical protein